MEYSNAQMMQKNLPISIRLKLIPQYDRDRDIRLSYLQSMLQWVAASLACIHHPDWQGGRHPRVGQMSIIDR